jgi:hypothetical protein
MEEFLNSAYGSPTIEAMSFALIVLIFMATARL